MAAPVFVAGYVPTADDYNDWLSNAFKFAYKPVNESVTNSAIAQDDDHLTLAVDSSKTYRVELFMNCTSTSATPDLAWRLNGPTGSVLYGSAEGGDTTASSSTGPLSIQTATLGVLNTNSARYSPVRFVGLLVVGGTSGTLSLQWCQNTSDAAATTMLTGSFLLLTRMA